MSGYGEPLTGNDIHLLRRGIAGEGTDESWLIDAERVVKVALNPDDELRNLQVVLSYALTSTRMAERISWSANPGDPRARTNANWFTMAQWAVLTVGRDMRSNALPHRVAGLPDVVRRRLTPAVLSLRSSDDRRVAASLSFGQVIVYCSIYRALLFHSHFADGLPMIVPEGRPPQEDDPIAHSGGGSSEPPEVEPPGVADVQSGDPAVSAMLKRMADADERRIRDAVIRDQTERETVVALAAQMGAVVDDIDPDATKDRKAFYAAVLHAMADLCPYTEELIEAFTLYQQAARWVNAPKESELAKTQRMPADLIFEASMRIAAVEQVILDKAVTAVIDQVPRHLAEQTEGRMATFAERSLRVPQFIAQVNSATRLAGATAVAKDMWARVMTDQVMVLALPSETLRLGRDIPSRDWRKPFYAPDLLQLSPQAQDVFDQYDRSLGDGRGAAAGDWRRFDDRMNFATNLIRSRQQDPSLFWQPFTDEDVAKIWNGQYPSRIGDPFEQAIRSPSTVFAKDFDVAGSLTYTGAKPGDGKVCSPVDEPVDTTNTTSNSKPKRKPAGKQGTHEGDGPAVSIWTHELLDELRKIGDPELDSTGTRPWNDVPAFGYEAGFGARMKSWRDAPHGACPEPDVAARDEYWTTPSRKMDPKQLAIAHGLFGAFGGEIGASLLLASLPNAYAAEAGAGVLTRTHELQSNTRRRVGETAQFVVEVLFPDAPDNIVYGPQPTAMPADDALAVGFRGYIRVRTTRLTHAAVRSLVTNWNPDEGAQFPLTTKVGVPINQEDLLGTLGTFTVTVFDVMEKLGVPWTDEAETAYLELWDRVGELLGIGTPAVVDALPKAVRDALPAEYKYSLRPKTPAEARELTELIRQRNWPVPAPGTEAGPYANRHGKVLVRSLLDELQSAMPRGMERVPLFVMRYLVDPRAVDLLGLGGGGLVDSVLHLPQQLRLTRNMRRNPAMDMVQMGMRLAASDVSRRAFVYFMRLGAEGDGTGSKFWFPVVDDPSVPQGRGMSPTDPPPIEVS